MNKEVRFINNGKKLAWNGSNFAIDPNTSNAFFSADYRDILLTVVGTGKVVVYGSCQKIPPDFSAASTITNSYVNVMVADYHLANTIYNGDDGISVSASTGIIEFNTNLLTFFAIKKTIGEGEDVDILLTETNAQ